eukprot:CCRYP_006026-RA/>CCRYP_006026-RA protein AED:0.46 eAED:0.46 QI:0/0.5/0.4/1/0/0/5/106/131
MLGEQPYVRIHYIVGRKQGQSQIWGSRSVGGVNAAPRDSILKVLTGGKVELGVAGLWRQETQHPGSKRLQSQIGGRKSVGDETQHLDSPNTTDMKVVLFEGYTLKSQIFGSRPAGKKRQYQGWIWVMGALR